MSANQITNYKPVHDYPLTTLIICTSIFVFLIVSCCAMDNPEYQELNGAGLAFGIICIILSFIVSVYSFCIFFRFNPIARIKKTLGYTFGKHQHH